MPACGRTRRADGSTLGKNVIVDASDRVGEFQRPVGAVGRHLACVDIVDARPGRHRMHVHGIVVTAPVDGAPTIHVELSADEVGRRDAHRRHVERTADEALQRRNGGRLPVEEVRRRLPAAHVAFRGRRRAALLLQDQVAQLHVQLVAILDDVPEDRGRKHVLDLAILGDVGQRIERLLRHRLRSGQRAVPPVRRLASD